MKTMRTFGVRTRMCQWLQCNLKHDINVCKNIKHNNTQSNLNGTFINFYTLNPGRWEIK